MKQKIFKYIILIIFFFTIIGTVGYYTFQKSTQNIERKEITKSKRYILKGAFKHPGVHESAKHLTYRELFFINKVMPQGDTSAFNLDDLAVENKEIYVPFKDYKLNWEDLRDDSQLILFGIGKGYAKKIFDFKEQKGKQVSWNDISKISGIGPKTIEKLKTFLILE